MDQRLRKTSFEHLAGWAEDDHAAAMEVFLNSARQMVEKPYKTRALGISSSHLASLSTRALADAPFDQLAARAFFEAHFQPCEIVETDNHSGGFNGFVTAYYEPEVRASRTRTRSYQTPLYKRPDDLVDVTSENRPEGFDPDLRFARCLDGPNQGPLDEYPDRRAISQGYLEGRGLEIAWVKDSVEALFIHIQGSARLCFDDGSSCRVGYAAKTGHQYTAVGKVLLERGALKPRNCGMQAIRDWFAENPDEVNQVINQNRSFIFFNEYKVHKLQNGPVGAAKVHLAAERSLAVDRLEHTFGSPVWIETSKPLPGSNASFCRLMIAQDTGSAIVGPARGDLFLGSGDYAGKIAGEVRHQAKFVVFVPVASILNKHTSE